MADTITIRTDDETEHALDVLTRARACIAPIARHRKALAEKPRIK